MAIFDELKSIGKVLQEAGKIDLYQQILNVQQQLLEMQNRIASLDKENKELKEKLEIKDSLIFENNAYWLEKDDKKDGPFCSCCWDNDRKPIRMQPCGNPAYFDCPKCKNKGVKIYEDKNIYTHRASNDFDQYAVI